MDQVVGEPQQVEGTQQVRGMSPCKCSGLGGAHQSLVFVQIKLIAHCDNLSNFF